MCCVVSHRLFCQIGNLVRLVNLVGGVFRLSGLSNDCSHVANNLHIVTASIQNQMREKLGVENYIPP